MYVYSIGNKIVEAALFVFLLLALSVRVQSVGITITVVLLSLLAIYWAWIIVRHWRAELITPDFQAAYRRLLQLLKERVGESDHYQMVSADEDRRLIIQPVRLPWYRGTSLYQVSIAFLGREEDWDPEPEKMITFIVPPSGFLVAHEMVRQQTDEGAVIYRVPQPSFRHVLKQVLLDRRIDNDMVVTEAELVYLENALLTWRESGKDDDE